MGNQNVILCKTRIFKILENKKYAEIVFEVRLTFRMIESSRIYEGGNFNNLFSKENI